MKKILLIIILLVLISGCSKQTKEQDRTSGTTPTINVTEGAVLTEAPSEKPTAVPSLTVPPNTFGMSSDATEQEVINKLLYEDSNNFTGMIGETKIHMELSYQEDGIAGTYYYDKYKKDIAIDGNIVLEVKEHPSVFLEEDTDNYGEFYGIISTPDCIKGYWRDDTHVYPMYLIREGSSADVPEKPDDYAKSYEGNWLGKNPSYYSGTYLDITALFDDMIYFDLEAYNGANQGSFSGIALLDQKSAAVMFWDVNEGYQLFEITQQGSNLVLNCSNYAYGCGMGVYFDNQYSKEETAVKEPTALEVGIVDSSEMDQRFFDLVRTYYSSFIGYTSSVAYEEIKLDGEKALAGESILSGLGGCCYYIISGENIYAAIIDIDDIKYFTNDWNYRDRMPQPMQAWADEMGLMVTYYDEYSILPFDEDIPNQLQDQMEQIKKGQKISLPDGYSLVDHVEGDINNDKEKDIVIVVQQYPGVDNGTRYIYIFFQEQGEYRLQYVNGNLLSGTMEGGAWGDPYDGITINNGELHVCEFGGNADRWSYDYGFKMSGDELILFSFVSGYYNTFSGDATKNTYDLLTGTVESTTYNKFDSSVEEQTTTKTFTIDQPIVFEETEEGQEYELDNLIWN